jgi:hypothetical protein
VPNIHTRTPLEVGIAFPAPRLIEDDIFQAANSLNCQVSAYLDPRSASEHGTLRHEGDKTMAHIPMMFETVRDAHRYAMLMFTRIVHSFREIGESAGDRRLSRSSELQILEEWVSALNIAADEDHSLQPAADVNAFEAQQVGYSLELSRWQYAFLDSVVE